MFDEFLIFVQLFVVLYICFFCAQAFTGKIRFGGVENSNEREPNSLNWTLSYGTSRRLEYFSVCNGNFCTVLLFCGSSGVFMQQLQLNIKTIKLYV